MAAVEPGTAMWSWGTTQSIDYFHRRLHLENLVHRVDAEQMAGLSSEIDTDEAADAVAERFEEFVHVRPERPSGSFHIHRTDGDGEWTAKVEDDRIVIAEEHAKGDAAAKGTGPELMLAMWGRAPVDSLQVFGEASSSRSGSRSVDERRTPNPTGLTGGSNLDQLMPVVLFFVLFNTVGIIWAVLAATAWSIKAAVGRNRGLAIGWWLPSVDLSARSSCRHHRRRS